MKGLVYLVGAGPGDPGLLTLKAKACLERADLVVYDTLANPDHLRHTRPSAKKICVEKGFRHHRLSQEKINRLIIREAKKGKTVVRLKGGDPYLFGRGGEEALVLAKHGVRFEVIPGVTSATACAAYAGIPLTHREHNASVTFLTGHRAHDEELDTIDWQRIIALSGTIVIYMGFYNLGRIAGKLIEKGMPPDTRIAVIEWGTLPRQRSCDGTLENIETLARKMKLGPPCIIIVGDVVSLRRQLNWYERLPLFGKRVVVTRAFDRSASLRAKLNKQGAEVIEFPVIETLPTKKNDALDRAVLSARNYDWIVFTSSVGATAFFERMSKLGKDARWLSDVRVACVGPETACAVRRRGLVPDAIPANYETAALPLTLKKFSRSLKGLRFLLVRTDIAPPALERALKKQGAVVTRAEGYRTKSVKPPARARAALLANPPNYVTFTSASTVESFIKAVGSAGVRALKNRAVFAAIGPVTSAALRRHGLKPGCQARVFTTGGLVDALRLHAERNKKKS